MIKISVIMGIYNCEKTLPAALDSMLAQTFKDIEIILCDDASTDGTYGVASEYAEKYDNIVLLKNVTNMRLAHSLNRCLEVARGEYIARMDADDISLPHRLERQLSFLESNPQYAVVGTALTVKDGDVLQYDIVFPEHPINGSPITSNPFGHASILMRRSVYDALGGYRVSPDTSRAEDLDLWFRFAKAGYDGYNIQESYYLYEVSLSDYKKRSVKAALGIRRVYLKYYKEIGAGLKYRILSLKPIVSALIPAKIMVKRQIKHGRKPLLGE